MRAIHVGGAFSLALLLANGCGQEGTDLASTEGDFPTEPSAVADAQPEERLVRYTEERAPCLDYRPLRKPLFGDVHVHTSYSFDAAANATGATPEDAHRFAKGQPIPFWPLDEDGKPAGEFSIDRPLDFLAVTDHGEFLGERALCRTPGSARYATEFCAGYRLDQQQGMVMFAQSISVEAPVRIEALCGEDGALCPQAAAEPWGRIVEAAEAAYDRSEQCTFSSFVGYEYTGTPGTSNYHRNVIFRNAKVPDLPVSYFEAPIDSRLWAALDAVCLEQDGCDYLTIPHNTNLSNGRMAPYGGVAQTAEGRQGYAAARLKREPIIEIFQHKGASECINGLAAVLGAPDELCDVEAVRQLGRVEHYLDLDAATGNLTFSANTIMTEECGDGVGEQGMLGAGCVDETDFVRSALLVGLKEEQEIGLNPIKLGIVAATDTHAATPGAVLEDDYRGHVTGEASPLERLQPGVLTSGPEGNPGGLAGVWAVENSRDAIFEAMQRREVFGTSGPRIVPRFFAGWGFAEDLCGSESLVEQGYAGGVPMGGDLGAAPSADAKPAFVALAARDAAASAAPLQQLQLIKGWIDGEGGMRNEVRTIAGSAEDAKGADSLCAVVQDEAFQADESAYYYLRVVQMPSLRWSAHDCQRIAEAERPEICSDGALPETTVEMAWTSPIWFRPATDGEAG